MNPLIFLRRQLLSAPLLEWYRKALPPLSSTEREALEAGNVWWDGELFSGRPDWSRLLAPNAPQLSAEERAFLDGPVEELCRMLDDWTINHHLLDLPPQVWDYIRREGFLGLIIPREYGGKGFSALAHSAVVMKLSTRSIAAGVTVMVPNSLGPAELLLHYGTPQQKEHYLPRLARGEELPAFALTGPYSGSDAASMNDKGVVCYGDYQGKRTLGIRVDWEKRYITLGPVATVLGVAFKLFDPERLLGGEEEVGITLALIPTDTPGVEIGRRHYPARQAFQNGPNRGHGVFVPMEWVIGGRERLGQGWRMLMEALAAGRAISLPALGCGATRYAARTTGAYARVRRQFKLPIGRFEGIEEPLARLAVTTYVLDAARVQTCGAVDRGERPAVLSAILKYQATERMRAALDDAMDIQGGKAICEGPGNALANAYHATPVAITVEGANILTRSLIIFGQGAIRAHPWLVAEMEAARERDLDQFDRALSGHVSWFVGNLWRVIRHSTVGAKYIKPPIDGPTARYFKELARDSARLALLADAAMALLGGELKRREALSGRFADILSELYLISCVLRRFEDDGRPQEDLPLVDAAARWGFYTVQERIDAILANFPNPWAGRLLRVLVLPRRNRRPPLDALNRPAAALLMSPGAARERLTSGIFIGRDRDDPGGRLDYALEKVLAAEPIETRLRGSGFEDDPAGAFAAGLIDPGQRQILDDAREAVRRAIDVDDFDPDELLRSSRAFHHNPAAARQAG